MPTVSERSFPPKMHRHTREKHSGIDRVFRILLFVIMCLFAFSYVFMFLWLMLNSFRMPGDFSANSFRIFDFKHFSFANYKELFHTNIGSSRNPVYLQDTILTTVILVFGQIALAVTIPAFTAYIVAKYKFRGRRLIFDIAIVTMIVPTLGSLTATYKFMLKLQLVNTYWGIFLMSAGGFGFGFLLFRNFFAAIPWEYAESAFLDGATDMQVFLRIMYPQAIPVIVALAITCFISCWNDYNTAYIYLREKPTVSLAVNTLYAKAHNSGRDTVGFAGMTILALVSLGIFGVFNKLIMNNVSAGGIKG